MTLTGFWFLLIAVLWTGFFVLEGFDMGVGMLHGVAGRDEAGRRTWDGLLTGGSLLAPLLIGVALGDLLTTLTVMTVVVATFLPVVLAYTAWTYHVFRRRLSTRDFQPRARPAGRAGA